MAKLESNNDAVVHGINRERVARECISAGTGSFHISSDRRRKRQSAPLTLNYALSRRTMSEWHKSYCALLGC
ncbi:hypothetical protein PUN28_004890 [Cardiocondyla obscurior]|uniref:Uncharacterized protein n=1 Tax=Cardiocondyla obscurior TaxID=286306 RepID=A0AAW2GEP9_9HYME